MANFVSIVLSVFNEADNVVEEYNIIKKAAERIGVPYEIIFVDDGSTDDSCKILSALPSIQLICLNKRMGCGYARKIGTMKASGDVIVWTDCDLSYPNYVIPNMFREMESKNYDQIIGRRICEAGNLKYLRFIIKWTIKQTASILTCTKIPDLNSGLRIFKRNVVSKYLFLLPNGFSCMATMTLAFICNGLKVGYFPIAYSQRSGRSKFHPIWDTIKYFIQVIRVIRYFKINKLK